MSIVTLGSGAGTPHHMEVDSNLEGRVRSRSAPLISSKALEGDCFVISTPLLSMTANAGLMAWMKFTGTDTRLVLNQISMNWNGGSTNYNRPCAVDFVIGAGEPTTNIATLSARNTNSTSSKALDVEGLYWNGTGDEMTGGTPGLVIATTMLAQGNTRIPIDGVIIIGPNTSLAINVHPEEAGDMSFTGYFFVARPGTDYKI